MKFDKIYEVYSQRFRAEDLGACPVACALAGKAGRGKIVCVVSGGNIDLKKLCAVLSEQPSW